MTAPEKDKTTPEKTGIGEENATPEATDRQSEKRDTPRKEGVGNDGEDDYLPTPPNGPETDNRNESQKKQDEVQSEKEMDPVASEQSEHAPRSGRAEPS